MKERANIAVLGWGSLIWDKRELAIIGEWEEGGPILPIEFSRISKDGRLTLVIDETNGAPARTRYAHCDAISVNDAIENLRSRECLPSPERIGFVNLLGKTERASHATSRDRIKAWAEAGKWDAVIWTGLPSNFHEKRGEPFNPRAALNYLINLSGEKKDRAVEYIRKAPAEVSTPFRHLFEESSRG